MGIFYKCNAVPIHVEKRLFFSVDSISGGLSTKIFHVCGNNEIDRLRQQTEFDGFPVNRFTVHIDDQFFITFDFQPVGAEVCNEIRIVGILAFGVGADDLEEGEAGDTLDDQKVKHAVVRARLRHGVEAAAVKAAVAAADQALLSIIELTVADDSQVVLNPLDKVDGETGDVAGGPADDGDGAVFMYVRADAGIDADRADIDAGTAIAVNDIQFFYLAVQQCAEIAEKVLLRAEGFDEVVAGAGGGNG